MVLDRDCGDLPYGVPLLPLRLVLESSAAGPPHDGLLRLLRPVAVPGDRARPRGWASPVAAGLRLRARLSPPRRPLLEAGVDRALRRPEWPRLCRYHRHGRGRWGAPALPRFRLPLRRSARPGNSPPGPDDHPVELYAHPRLGHSGAPGG